MSMSTLDSLLAGGGKTAKFEKVGDSYTGVVQSAEVRQASNFDTGKPEFWDDGNPKQQIVVSIQTSERVDEEDDGVRAVYIKGWGDQKKALQRASKEAGGSPAVGDTFTATYVGDGEKPQRGFAPKIYQYKIKKGSPLDAVVNSEAPAAASGSPWAAGPNASQIEQIKKLLLLGLAPDKIAQAVDGVTAEDAEAVRLQMAADSSSGF